MPQIRQFDTPALGLRPTETGIETVAGNARRLAAFTNQVAGAKEQLASDKSSAFRSVGNALGSGIQAAGDAYVNYLDHKEISAGAAKGTELMATLTDQWNKLISNPKLDPNDPTIKQKFMQENLEPALQQFKDDSGFFTTDKSQQFAESFIERFRNHMETKTSADMSTLAGIALKVNTEKTVNAFSSMVATDPSSLDFAIKSVDHAIDAKVGSSPTLDATTAASVRSEVGLKAKENIVKSAIIGMIQKNPNVDLDAIQKKYGDYINGAEMKLFQKTAQSQAKADLIQQKQVETYQRQVQERAAHDAYSKVITDNFNADDNGKLTINPNAVKQTLDIMRKYPEGGDGGRTMINFIEAQQNKELKVQDNPAVVSDLSTRMFDPNNPTTTMDLMRARTKGQISDHTFSAMHQTVKELEEMPLKGPVYQDTMKAVHGALVLTGVGIPGKDDVGERNYASFVQGFVPQYLAKARAGTLEPNALDIKDPNSMISKAMEPYKRTLTDRINDYVSVLGKADVTEGSGKHRTFGGVPVPEPLAGIAALRRNPATGQWRDEVTGKIYDKDGREISK